MSDLSEMLTLPPSLRRVAERLAEEDGVSLNHWVAMAVAQKVGAVETAAEFFRRRSASGSPQQLRAWLTDAPDVEPDERDRIV